MKKMFRVLLSNYTIGGNPTERLVTAESMKKNHKDNSVEFYNGKKMVSFYRNVEGVDELAKEEAA